ncbi:hypothetical protein [Streptomyces sp. NPDC048106]|uniref:hypothetical protein n=1 Tax=Streptomyces sp. NPDC048106 TaxID=3155750 RepID=UPI003452085E
MGSGLFMISAALFFTCSVGLSVERVGLGMGIGALVGLLSGVPIGRLADRRGPREVYLVTLCVQAAAITSPVLVRSFRLFALVVCLTEASALVIGRLSHLEPLGAPAGARQRSAMKDYPYLVSGARARPGPVPRHLQDRQRSGRHRLAVRSRPALHQLGRPGLVVAGRASTRSVTVSNRRRQCGSPSRLGEAARQSPVREARWWYGGRL